MSPYSFYQQNDCQQNDKREQGCGEKGMLVYNCGNVNWNTTMEDSMENPKKKT